VAAGANARLARSSLLFSKKKKREKIREEQAHRSVPAPPRSTFFPGEKHREGGEGGKGKKKLPKRRPVPVLTECDDFLPCSW